ncbi:MAG TPA: RpiB/LacA/LacB family sugar-phosphate isomerase, partial [Terriglobia bacterium]|nr:RpiB/LacA/LacB family sugar-phosphate isomerase [Terriglobia bacterium]
MNKPVLTESDIKRLEPGSSCYVLKGTLVTALAQELAVQRQIPILECESAAEVASLKAANRRVALGADHGGWMLKEGLKPFLQDNGYLVLDCGTQNGEAVDYPDFALEVAKAVRTGQAFCGIMVDGLGTGSCIVANKVPGIRASLCYDRLTARSSREHNDANMLTLGGQV